jgi:tetratricopeptide (TPR) repeat protein
VTLPPGARALVVPAVLGAAVVGGWWAVQAGHPASRAEAPTLAATPAVRLAALTDEALRLYAAGQFPRACDRFSRAAEDDPTSAARRADVARCFEGWGWDTLKQGRPEEAMLLFRQGLGQEPDEPALLRALGLAAVHAGRADDAVGALEAAAAAEGDPEVLVLLAHLHDRRDDSPRALAHLRTLLARDPDHDAARRLLAKIEREAQAEAGLEREVTSDFVVKWRPGLDRHERRVLLAALDSSREHVVTRLGAVPRERVTVVLYEAARFPEVAGVHDWVSGVFDGKIRLPGDGPPRSPRQLERLLVHEYAHAVVHDVTRGRAPRWLHEGLAQALEGTPIDPLFRVPGRLTLAGLEGLLGDADPARARTGYDIARWIVHDLLDRGGMPAMRALLTRLGGGERIETAVPAVYGLGLNELEDQWRGVLGG